MRKINKNVDFFFFLHIFFFFSNLKNLISIKEFSKLISELKNGFKVLLFYSFALKDFNFNLLVLKIQSFWSCNICFILSFNQKGKVS